MFVAGVLLGLLLAAEPSSAAPTTVEVWVGHHILRGTRHVPLKGPVATETQNYMLAKVVRQGHRLEIQQHFCRIENKPVGKVTVTVPPATVALFPVSPVSVELAPDGSATVSPWTVFWGRNDLEGDGHPGATFTVSGTFCSGDLYVSSQSQYSADKVQFAGGQLTGELKVEQHQQILGASGFCLRNMVGDSTDHQSGTFAYRAVPAGTTCGSLAGKPWPVKAASPAPAPK